jgi:hypothetical protein
MKTAYELAMERLGGTRQYTEEQKRRMAEIDSLYQAKIAEARLRAEDRLKARPDAKEKDPEAKDDRVREELAGEVARLERKREAEKERIRNEAK